MGRDVSRSIRVRAGNRTSPRASHPWTGAADRSGGSHATSAPPPSPACWPWRRAWSPPCAAPARPPAERPAPRVAAPARPGRAGRDLAGHRHRRAGRHEAAPVHDRPVAVAPVRRHVRLLAGRRTRPFVADSPSCRRGLPDATAAAAWLRAARATRPDGDGWRLSTASGRVLAGLVPGGRITPRADVDPSLSDPPALGDAATSLRATAPLPSRLRPVTSERLVGRWVPDGARPRGRGVPAAGRERQLAGLGRLQRLGRRWTIGQGSRVLATAGASTEIGCDNVDVGRLVVPGGARRHRRPALVLVDRAGGVLATLTRTPQVR